MVRELLFQVVSATNHAIGSPGICVKLSIKIK